MNKVQAIALLILFTLASCASNNTLYEWDHYEQTLFIVYHEPAYKEKALKNYLVFVENHHKSKPLAPGLYAEAGTFLLEQGDYKGAIGFYKLEYESWPESRPMLSALIKNLEKRK